MENFKVPKLRVSQFQSFRISNFRISKLKKKRRTKHKSCIHIPSNIFRISDSQICNNICSRMLPIVLYFVKYFGDRYGVRGSRFGHIFRSSRNHPKSIAIDQESLISHFSPNIVYNTGFLP